MSPRPGFSSRRRALIGVGAALSMSVIVLIGISRLIPKVDSASIAAAAAENAAISAIQNETESLGSSDTASLSAAFTGGALGAEQNLRNQVQKMIASGSDYPGKTTLSNVQIESLSGDYQTTMTLDFSAHVTLANMKAAVVQDYSQSDLVYHVVLTNVAGAWKVTSIESQFAPGGGP